MKSIRLEPTVPTDVRAIDQSSAMSVLRAIHRYAETGVGDVKTLSGDLGGLRRLRVGNYRVLFDETGDTITIHRVRHRREAYR